MAHGDDKFLKTIDLKHTLVQLRADHIIQLNFGDNVEYNFPLSWEIVKAIGELTYGTKALILNIAGIGTTANADARAYSASEEGLQFTIADAFVINSMAQRLLGNLYLKFDKPKVPTRLFEDKEKAIEWLKEKRF